MGIYWFEPIFIAGENPGKMAPSARFYLDEGLPEDFDNERKRRRQAFEEGLQLRYPNSHFEVSMKRKL